MKYFANSIRRRLRKTLINMLSFLFHFSFLIYQIQSITHAQPFSPWTPLPLYIFRGGSLCARRERHLAENTTEKKAWMSLPLENDVMRLVVFIILWIKTFTVLEERRNRRTMLSMRLNSIQKRTSRRHGMCGNWCAGEFSATTFVCRKILWINQAECRQVRQTFHSTLHFTLSCTRSFSNITDITRLRMI